jgi:hypothetical protein
MLLFGTRADAEGAHRLCIGVWETEGMIDDPALRMLEETKRATAVYQEQATKSKATCDPRARLGNGNDLPVGQDSCRATI